MPQQYKYDRVDVITKALENAKSVYMTDFTGLSVEEITDLRRRFRKENVSYLVVKNTLAKLSAEKVGLKDMVSYLTGPTGLAVSYDDPIAPVRVIAEFQKAHKKPELRAAILEGKLLDEKAAVALKDIPPREVLLGQVVSGIAAPLSGLVGGLQGILRNLVYVLNAVKDKKE